MEHSYTTTTNSTHYPRTVREPEHSTTHYHGLETAPTTVVRHNAPMDQSYTTTTRLEPEVRREYV